jgi:hypothetical protein
MSALVAQTGTTWQGADHNTADVLADGKKTDAIQAWADADKLMPPLKRLESFLILEDGTRVVLPFNGLCYRIPDHTGVIALFEPGQYLRADGTDYFPYPNNAAIFNADASLRCQVHFAGDPLGNKDFMIERLFTRRITHKSLSYGRVGDPIDPPIVQFGVLVGTKEAPPENFYIVNTETGELTDGMYSVPY